MTNNFDNEVEILKSCTLISVVNDLEFICSCSGKERSVMMPLYVSQVRKWIYMTPEEADKFEERLSWIFTFTKTGKLSVIEYVR